MARLFGSFARPLMILTDPLQLHSYVASARELGECAFDTETTGLKSSEGARLCGFSLYHPKLGGFYAPVRHQGLFVENAPESIIQELAPLFDGSVLIIGHNLSFDLPFLSVEGIDPYRAPVWDTQYASFLWRNDLDSYALKPLAITLFKDEALRAEKDLLDTWLVAHPKASYDFVPLEVIGPYAERDAELAWHLREYLLPRILSIDPCYEGLIDEEMRWVKLLAKMSMEGLLVDLDRLKEIEHSHEQRYIEVCKELSEAYRPGFNPNAPTQVKHLCDWLKVPLDDSTEEIELVLRADEFPILNKVILARQLSKVLTSWLRPYRQYARAGGGRVHTSFGSAGGRAAADTWGFARTGRLRSRDPNLQAVPAYDEDIYRVKEIVVAPEGWKLVSLDFSQAEIRIVAHYTQDPRLISELNDPNGDVHGAVAKVLDMPRRGAKRVVFGGGIYGAGDITLAVTLTQELKRRVSPEEAAVWRATFHRRFPRFPDMMRRAERAAKQRGYVKIWSGQRFWFTNEKLSDPHKAFNTLIQAGVASVVKRGMLAVDDYIQERRLRARITLQIHDEILIFLPEAELCHIPEFASLLTSPGPTDGWTCPLRVEVTIGDRWSELKEWGVVA